MPVKWNPPEVFWLKLNTASRISDATGQASRGGTIRDHRGQLLLAFCMPLVASSTLETSAKTVRLGIAEAKAFASRIWLETNDPQVIPLVKSGSYGPAQSRQDMARLLLMQRECTFNCSAICSVKNKAAIWLAKYGNEITSLCHFNGHTAPTDLKEVIRMEQEGIQRLNE